MILIISSALTTIASAGAAISIGNKKEGFIQSHGSRATPPCFSLPPPPYRPKLRGRMEYSQVYNISTESERDSYMQTEKKRKRDRCAPKLCALDEKK
ncbi:hypothetical protein HID58_042581 [Brassica napus]|uniref:Secreted protein n=1 Tax=Brassica napus TaxID=3708 RepID=A0ABQ8BEG0_BRANA|nr:hypothetical protein HID58_042581 [Brassica napus]